MKNLDWSSLGFGYLKTDHNVYCYYRNGKWDELKISSEETATLYMGATCLHYGQEAFEGLKAYRGKNGKIRLFRVEENAKRMIRSAEGIVMTPVPEELFVRAVKKVAEPNKDFIPPYESGASLYIRPLLLSLGAQVGVKPAPEYLFIVFVSPVGPYFKEGFKPISMAIMRGYDRAAPLGTGTVKVGGNYAAGMVPTVLAHEKGYNACLFLDAKEKKYTDEYSPVSFFGIKDNTYITPESTSILLSITNKSLMQLAEDLGLKVERRHVPGEELAALEEAGACGTAVVISPTLRVDDLDKHKTYQISKGGKPGPICERLYNKLHGIQYGDEPDTHGWVTLLD